MNNSFLQLNCQLDAWTEQRMKLSIVLMIKNYGIRDTYYERLQNFKTGSRVPQLHKSLSVYSTGISDDLSESFRLETYVHSCFFFLETVENS